MFNNFNHLSYALSAALVSASFAIANVATAQETTQERGLFPDVSPDYWASESIERLAEENIVVGYPDGTFKPEKAVERDEFAAMIHQAFNQERERSIDDGTVFEDVPNSYWAAPPIEDAYEMGFMESFSDQRFLPKEPMTRLDAVTVLAQGLNLSYTPSSETVVNSLAMRPQQPETAQPRVTIPLLGFASLLAPLFQPEPATATPGETQPEVAPQAAPQTTNGELSASEYVSRHYEDAGSIPEGAVEDIAAATQANILPSELEGNQFQPNELLSRGGAAAMMHQTLVQMGRLEPISENN
ncbi:MAG: S-layer homology domain-containing protein [Chroococcales cyanobacterium]